MKYINILIFLSLCISLPVLSVEAGRSVEDQLNRLTYEKLIRYFRGIQHVRKELDKVNKSTLMPYWLPPKPTGGRTSKGLYILVVYGIAHELWTPFGGFKLFHFNDPGANEATRKFFKNNLWIQYVLYPKKIYDYNQEDDRKLNPKLLKKDSELYCVQRINGKRLSPRGKLFRYVYLKKDQWKKDEELWLNLKKIVAKSKK